MVRQVPCCKGGTWISDIPNSLEFLWFQYSCSLFLWTVFFFWSFPVASCCISAFDARGQLLWKKVNFEADSEYFEFLYPKIHAGTFTASIHAGFKGIFCNLNENSPGSIFLLPPPKKFGPEHVSEAFSFLLNLGSAYTESWPTCSLGVERIVIASWDKTQALHMQH